MAVYVYGVLDAGQNGAHAPPGVQDAEVRRVEHDGLAALVSDVQGDALAAAREVRAHWRVIEAASKDATVLPARFGTLLEDDEAVRERVLDFNSERLRALLEELTGRVQLTVKGAYDEERLLREILAGSPAVASLREHVRTLPGDAGYYDRIRLGEAVSAEIEAHRARDTELALQRLEPRAVAARAQEPRAADTAFDLAFLVERDRIDAFSAGVLELDRELGERVALRYVGPLPPYSFAEAELTWA